MKKIAAALLMLALTLVFALATGVGAEEAAPETPDYTDYDTALDYLDRDNYKENVGSDPHLPQGICVKANEHSP